VDDVDVAVFKVENKVYALSNVCPHQHAPVIYNGFIEDGHVACPNHGWEFDLKTGDMKTPGKGLDIYKVKIENDEVFVKVIKKKDWDW
jgi:3-phenylpropionate/trans-cinnamate dioxygenase ferredoxin subunit